MSVFAVGIAVVLLFAGIFYYRFFRRMLLCFMPRMRRGGRIFLGILLTLCMLAWAGNIRGVGIVVLLYMALYAISLDLIVWIIKKVWTACKFSEKVKIHQENIAGEEICPEQSDRDIRQYKCRAVGRYMYQGGLLVVLLTAATIAYGYYNMDHVYETRYEMMTDKLPEGEILRVVVISDLHLGMNMDAEELKGYLDEIQSKNVDVLLLTGDIFDEGTTLEDMRKAAEYFGDMDTTYGSFYVYGNHDVNQYRQDKEYEPQAMTGALAANGVMILADEFTRVEAEDFSFYLIGRQDRSFGNRASVGELTEYIPKSGLKILMDHQPAEMEEKARCGIDLQVSGHTHAGQVWPFGQFSEIAGFNEMNYGLHEYDDMTAVVSSGIAGWGFPVRTAEHCEYVIIDIIGE